MKLERHFNGQFPVLLLHTPSSPIPIVIAAGEMVWAAEEKLKLPIKGSYKPAYTKKE
jgi:hypothetical protein